MKIVFYEGFKEFSFDEKLIILRESASDFQPMHVYAN
jgi:hypothetical protein